MKIFVGLVLALLAPLAGPAGLTPCANAADSVVKLVAAENFYGDIARQIGGPRVEVVSILSSPDQDPHLFETSPATVRQIAAAQIVIYNGASYDPWMAKLMTVAPRPGRAVIVAADLVRKRAGDNPHLWYDPPTAEAVARALAAALAKADPDHAAGYTVRLAAFLASLKPLHDKIGAVAKKYGGTSVTASEPVVGYLAAAMGLTMRNEKFQMSIMNDTEPSARDIAAFERDLKEHKVRLMFYNKQASDKTVQHLVDIARAANVPVVGVTETIPPGLSFQDWMMGEISEIEKALAGPSS
jgi:zinc/manganese transport system substrate-binding protein